MILGALQPGYLPWLGFFEQVYRVEMFLLCDELKYEKKSWRSRNRIKTNAGPVWLTVPVVQQDVYNKAIKDVRIENSRDWKKKHWSKLVQFYHRAPFFKDYEGFLKEIYKRQWDNLAALDIELTRYLVDVLGIKTELIIQSDLKLEDKFNRVCGGGDATDRLIFLCKEFGADALYEGQSGKGYIDEERVSAAGIKVTYQDYSHPVYPQLYGEFVPYLSVVDLMFNCGKDSLGILTGKEAYFS